MIKIILTIEEQSKLEQVVKSDPRAYMRERASAILKISSGKSALYVAQYGLLRPRRVNTVYEWVDRYLAEGIKGLENRKGRGRKPSFFP